ncbi:MAG: sensor histidine kinase, partial [Pedobacter sp.]
MKQIVCCIALCLALLAGRVKSQPLYFRHYQVENGLSHNTVFCTIQDRQGFMWFGTKDGLNRFDGYNFKVYRNKAGDKKSLGSNLINSLLIDSKGKMWVCTVNGVYSYNKLEESFDLLAFTAGKEAGLIKEDSRGDLWMTLNHILFKFDRKSGEHTAYSGNKTEAKAIMVDYNGDVWVSYHGGLQRYDFKKDSFTFYDLFSKSANRRSKAIAAMHSMDNGIMLVGSDQGLKIFDPRSGTYRDVIRYSADKTDLYIRDIIKSTKEEYWLATESGIYIYNARTGEFNVLRKDHTNPYAVSDDAIYDLFKDKEGSVWATTYFGGINYCDPQNAFFEKFFPNTPGGSLKGSAVREIIQGRTVNELFIGTEDAGLNKFDLSTRRFTHFNSGPGPEEISSTNIHGLLLDGSNLWIGTFNQGIYVKDLNTNRLVKHYIAKPSPGQLTQNYIEVIYKTRSGRILIGTPGGLWQYNGVTDGFDRVSEVAADVFVNAVIEDHEGTIWIASGTGLHYFNPQTKTKGRYQHSDRDTASISSNNIIGIFEDSRRQLWIMTETGLNKYVPGRKAFVKYTVNNGFPSDFMFKMLEDDQGLLWVTSTKGLVRFNSLTGEATIYTTANGLLSDQFNYNSAFKDAAGRLYFGCIKGYISFDPKLIRSVRKPPQVYIIGFQIDNREVALNEEGSPLKQSIITTEKIRLAADQRSISVDFAALSYVAPQTTRYAYKLEGLEKEWTYLKTNRKIYFTKLAPGSYKLRVKSANSAGDWNPVEATLSITVSPPFYASIWAYLFYAAVCSAAVYYGFKNYHFQTQLRSKRRMEHLENEMAREVYQSKIEFFTNITHEIRTPLTLIKAPLEKAISSDSLEEIRKNFELMQKNTDRLLNLTDQLLDFRKIEKEGLKLNFVKANLSVEVREIYTLFRPYAEGRIDNYILILPPTPVYAFIDPEAFHKIMSNLINNAVKYAVNFVQIELRDLSAGDTSFTIEIKNDGALIPAGAYENIFKPFFRVEQTDHKGTGLGLPLAKSLAEIHNGELTIVPDSRFNVFALSLPVHQRIEFDLMEGDQQVTLVAEKELAAQDEGLPVILLVEDHI